MINEFKLAIEAMLDKVKSLANFKNDIKSIEPKLPKVKFQGTFDDQKVKKEISSKLKNTTFKIKVDADTKQAESKIEKLTKKQRYVNISPKVNNTQLTSDFKDTEKQTQSFFDKFTNNIAGLNVLRIAFYKIAQAASKAVENVKDLDTIKTNIQMAAQVSNSEADNMMKTYNQMGKELSSTTKKVAESADEFIRMGESVSSTNELIKNAQMLSTLGKIDNTDAASYLISGMKGYNIAAEDSIKIVDKLTATDMEAAVSAGGLAEALSKTSNIANTSGVSLNRLIGYVSVVGESTQKTMSEVGNSFQSIFSRMNNIKINRFIDDESGESLSDTETVLNKLGIKLRDTEDTYRDFDDVLDDIGKKWNLFTQKEQKAISVAIAGTRQRENFTALMNRYGDALKYSEVAANSAGTAMKRYEQYQDSIDAKTNKLTNSLEALSMNTISEDLYKGILEATTGIVEFVDKTNLLKGSLAGLATYGASKMFVTMASGIISAAKSTAQLTSVMAMFNNGRTKDNLINIGTACQGLTDNQVKLVLSTTGLTNAQRLLILHGKGVEESQLQQTLTTLGFSQAENTATASTFSFAGALNSLKAAFVSNPIGIAIMAITTAISIGTMAYSKYKQSIEETRQATSDATNAYKETASSIDDYAEKYKKLHDELTKANTTEERQQEIKSDLLSLQQELNEKYGDEYGKINLVTDAYKDQTEAIREYTKAAAERFLNENRSGIETATEEMEKSRTYGLSFGLKGDINEDYAKEVYKIASKYGDQGLDINPFDNGNGKTGYVIKFEGDASQANDVINSFATEVKKLEETYKDNDFIKEILDNSEDALKDSKTVLDNSEDTYNSALEKQIITSEKLSVGYNSAKNAVKAYNEALASGDETKILLARDDLEKVKGSIDLTSDDWKNYGRLMTNIFDQADTSIYDFQDAIRNPSSSIHSLVDEISDIKVNVNTQPLDDAKNQLEDMSKNGDVDLTVRPVIDSSKLEEAGWGEQEPGIATVYSSAYSNEDETQTVLVTPILPDGSVLSPEDLESYAMDILDGKQVDVDIKLGMFNGDDSIEQAEKYADKLHLIQQEFYDTSSSANKLANGTKLTETDFLARYDAASDDINDPFVQLKQDVEDYGLSVEQVIPILKNMGIIQGEVASSGVNITGFVSEFSNLPIDKLEEYITLLNSGKLNENNISSFSELKDIMSQTGVSAEEAVKAIKSYSENYTLSTDLISNLHDAYDLLQSVNEQYKETGKIGLSSLEAIVKQYPQLRTAVNEYTQGLISADDVMGQLNTAYEADTEAYKNSMVQRFSENTAFFEKVKNNNQTLFDNLGKAYNLDVSNWKTMAQAKAEIDQTLIRNLSDAWAKYYNIVYDSNSKLASISGGLDYSHVGSQGMGTKAGDYDEEEKAREKAWSDANKQVNTYNQIIREMNEAANIEIEPFDFDGAGSGKSSSSKDKSDTAKQIDWVKRYLDMLNDERQELVDSASKYSSEYTQQIIALDKQILPETQKAVETYKKAWEDAASKLSKSDRAKVELGYTDIDTYSGDNADNIQAAIDSFDKYQNMQKQYAEAEKASNETLLTQYDADIAKLENKNEALASQNSLIESQIDYYKEIGSIVSASDYTTMLDNVGDEIDNVNGKISDLKLKLNLARELYGSDSEEYDDVKDAISNAEDELYSLNKKQAQYNKTLAEMPITNLSTIISMYEDIGNKIENYGKMATATGQKLNADYYQKLISNQSTVLDQYEKQIKEIKSLMSEYEKGSDNWQELYDQLQSIDSSMASIVENMAQLNEELLQMPLDHISTYSDSLQKVITGLTDVQSEYDTILSAVNNGIQDRIDLLGEEQEKASDAQQIIIDGLQDELDLLQKTNEARERQLAVEQDEYDLAKAQGQRNIATVRNGIVDYENDNDAIRDAQEALANSKEDLAEYNLEQQIDDAKTALDNLNDSYQDQIDSLQEIADKWSEISSIQKGISDANLATSLLGNGWLDKIVSGNGSEIYETLSSLYQTNAKQLDEYQKQAQSTENIQALIEDYVNSYKAGEISYDQALGKIDGLLTQLNQNMSASTNLNNILDYLSTTNGTEANSDAVLRGIQSGLKDTASELLKSMEQYNKNSGMISEYTSSWQQLTDNVASMLNVLKEVRDNLKDSEDDSDDDDNDNTKYGGGKDGSPGTPGKGEYVNSGPGVSRKDGITRGLIGSSSDADKEASLKLLGLKKLDPDEIPAVLHMGEAVFNKEQQQKLLENFGTAWNYKPNIPDYSSLLSNVKVTNKSEAPTITFNGGINIQECNKADDLATEILKGGLTRAVIQGLGRR